MLSFTFSIYRLKQNLSWRNIFSININIGPQLCPSFKIWPVAHGLYCTYLCIYTQANIFTLVGNCMCMFGGKGRDFGVVWLFLFFFFSNKNVYKKNRLRQRSSKIIFRGVGPPLSNKPCTQFVLFFFNSIELLKLNISICEIKKEL